MAIKLTNKQIAHLSSKSINWVLTAADGETPLIIFARDKSIGIERIIQNWISANPANPANPAEIKFAHQNIFGMTALMCAIRYGSEKNALVLARYTDSLGLRDSEGCSALHHAIHKKMWAVVAILIARMEQRDLASNYLMLLLSQDQFALAEAIVDRIEGGASEPTPSWEIYREDITILLSSEFFDSIILPMKCFDNIPQGYRDRIPDIATAENIKTIVWLLEHGADPDCKVAGMRLIEHCVKLGAKTAANLLIHYGARGV